MKTHYFFYKSHIKRYKKYDNFIAQNIELRRSFRGNILNTFSALRGVLEDCLSKVQLYVNVSRRSIAYGHNFCIFVLHLFLIIS